MLGKGLESLIPPNHKPVQDETHGVRGNSETNSPSDLHQASSLGTPLPSSPQKEHLSVVSDDREALFKRKENQKEKIHDAVFHIEVEKIKPNSQQPRRNFDEEGIKDLALSIREFGLLQPIVVTKIEREVPNGTEVEYQLISGERRLLAVKYLGLERVPAIIRHVNFEQERLELAIVENIQRENLNPIETARAFSRLQDEFRLTQREIAARLGKSRETVANTVRLLDLPIAIQDALSEGKITESHGRLLLAIEEPALQHKLFEDLLTSKMTTRDLKNRVRVATESKSESGKEPHPLPPELLELREKLSSELGAPVDIHTSGDAGKITITFYSPEELRNIMDHFQKHSEGL